MKENLYVYYTNDLHSNFDNWSKVASFLKDQRAKLKEENISNWLVDIGDHIDRVHPIAEAFMGKANVQLMNELNYDLVTIGNNEGITLPHHELFHLYDEAQFQIICSNLESMTNEIPKWLLSSKIMHSVHGVKIGVIGLTAPFNPFYHLLNWHVKNPVDTVSEELKRLNGKADVIIVLSHLGINEDRELARQFSEIDVIIGGHTHHLLRTAEEINGTIITSAGKHCTFVGEVILIWDHSKGQLTTKEAYTTNITHFAKDLPTEQSLNRLYEKAEKVLQKPIIQRKKPIEVNWFKSTKIMEYLTEELREFTKADISMLNAGILLDVFPAGTITYGDVHRICPHPINPCVVELSGNEIIEVVRASLTKEFMELKLKGFGFRGEVLGKMIFSGLEVKTAYHDNGREYVKEVLYLGNPLRLDRMYLLATADTFTFGRLLPEIAKSETKKFFLPEFIRDLLVKTLKEYFSS